MMNAMPRVRRQIEPTTSATTVPAASAAPTCTQPLPMPWKDSMPTAYAPSPMYIAWPKLTIAP